MPLIMSSTRRQRGNATPTSTPTPAQGSRLQQKASTRRAILDAAIASFARLGYDGTNFREITADCGAQRSLILYHFQSKEELWRQAVQEVELRFNEDFESRFQPGGQDSDRERIRYTMSCFVDTLCAVPEYGQILLREGSTSGPRMEWLAHHFVPRRTLSLQLDDPAIEQRIRTTVLRDILASTLVAFIALGPLMERARAVATQQRSVGIHPLSDLRKQEFVDYMVRLVMQD